MINKYFLSLLSFSLFWLLILNIYSESEENHIELPPIEVTSTRVEKEINKVPFSISLIDKDQIQLGKQAITLDESLNKIPGVYVQNRYNFAQDQRISIRGFGSRAAFGVRGIKIIYDGIPLTLPDGQSQTDSLDLSSAERIEVIRGPVSALYGNSSGGVISIFSETGDEKPFVEIKPLFGSFGLFKFNAKTGGKFKNFNYLINISRLNYDGFRDHSKTENIQLNSNFNYLLGNNSDITVVLNFIDAPTAKDPGSLTKEQINQDRNQAASGNLASNSGEQVKQLRFGLRFNSYINDNNQVEALTYIITRDFEQRLPFGIISFDRVFLGGGLKYILSSKLFNHNNRLIIGTDIEYQDDDRLNFSFTDDFKKDSITLDQTEQVFNLGIYLQNEFSLLDNLELSLGLRYDYYNFSVDDFLINDNNPDQSGSRSFSQLNPKIGVLYSPADSVNLYGNFSTSFETPTTTEFINNPDGSGGLNPDLDPQETIGYEIGAKGVIQNNLQYDLALFYADIDDQLIPFEVEGFAGREFFRNAGKSRQYGLELLLDYLIIKYVNISFSYTYLNFEFRDFRIENEIFDGNDVPGIPDHQIFANILYKSDIGFYGGADLLYVSDFFVNDSNSEKNGSYTVLNLRTGFERSFYNKIRLNTFLGLNNILDEKYNSSVRVNAFGDRFFEPAPQFNLFGGFSVKYTI
ncbi:MAG: TonB-dependent receptor [Candidatus Dadabacteria bacterium]|nr:TonB-dependent receptor [Candidatus Dadabacteria bacterium]